MHILPDLEAIEKKYPEETGLIVVSSVYLSGLHLLQNILISTKFLLAQLISLTGWHSQCQI